MKGGGVSQGRSAVLRISAFSGSAMSKVLGGGEQKRGGGRAMLSADYSRSEERSH